MIKKLCILLSLVMALSLFGACSSSDNSDNISSDISSDSNEEQIDEFEDTIEENTSDDFDDEYYDEYEEEFEDFFDDFYSGDEEKVINKLHVYNNEKPLTTRYGGMSGTVWHAYGFMKDDKTGRVYTDKMMNTELERLQTAGMHYCRTRYASEWVWDPITDNYNFSSNRFGYFCDYAKALQDRDINVLLQVGWHFGFVSWINSHNIEEVEYLNGTGEDKFGESTGYNFSNLSSEEVRITKAARRFGYFYAETLRNLRARGINNISHLVYMTEPANGFQGAPVGAENEAYVLFSRAFKQKLTEENLAHTVKHMGPNETSKTGDHLFKYVVDNAPDLFDVYTVHNYPVVNDTLNDTLYDVYGLTLDSFVGHAKKAGILGKKEFWLDEYDVSYPDKGKGSNNAWEGLQNVYGNLIAQQKGVETTVFWQLIDQLWTDSTSTNREFEDGIHVTGDIPSLFVSATPYDQYYATGLFSRYNGYKNGKSYRTSLVDDAMMYEGVYIGAVQLEDGNWTITVVNLNIDEAYLDISLDKALNKTMFRHVFDSAKNVADPSARLADVDKYFVNVKNKIFDTIPGGSVVVYTSLEY